MRSITETDSTGIAMIFRRCLPSEESGSVCEMMSGPRAASLSLSSTSSSLLESQLVDREAESRAAMSSCSLRTSEPVRSVGC